MTNEDVFLYEETTGTIEKIAPSHRKELPSEPKPTQKGGSRVHYICEPGCVEEIRRSGRFLADIAVVCSKSLGRDDTLITRLVWAANPHIEVRLHANAAAYL